MSSQQTATVQYIYTADAAQMPVAETRLRAGDTVAVSIFRIIPESVRLPGQRLEPGWHGSYGDALAASIAELRRRLAADGLQVVVGDNAIGQRCMVAAPAGATEVELSSFAVAR